MAGLGRKRKAEIVIELLARDGRACFLCGGVMDLDFSADRLGPEAPTIEHKVARSANGSNDLRNLALAHRRCNEKRADKPLFQHVRRERTGPIPNPLKAARL